MLFDDLKLKIWEGMFFGMVECDVSVFKYLEFLFEEF